LKQRKIIKEKTCKKIEIMRKRKMKKKNLGEGDENDIGDAD